MPFGGCPGVGKPILVETMATVMGVSNARVQFTPDLMPTDILGVEVLEDGADGTRQFRFQQGPVFASLLLADEINRASPVPIRPVASDARASRPDAGEIAELPKPSLHFGNAKPD